MLDPSNMSEYQKAAVETIREVSIQLILISVGAMSVAGSILGTRTQQSNKKWRIKAAMTFLSLSVLVGVVTLGSLMAQLSAGAFDLWEPTMRFAYLTKPNLGTDEPNLGTDGTFTGFSAQIGKL